MGYIISLTLGDAFQLGLLEEIDFSSPAQAKFHCGIAAITPFVRSHLKDVDLIRDLFCRHVTGDFGSFGCFESISVSEQDISGGVLATDDEGKLNKLAVLGHYSGILSEYTIAGQTIWLKTENLNLPGTHTVMMLPSEY